MIFFCFLTFLEQFVLTIKMSESKCDYENDSYAGGGYEWTEEDSWDALTDGMYGDMPTDPLMYDAIMESMGF